jgi:hypothetical protein
LNDEAFRKAGWQMKPEDLPWRSWRLGGETAFWAFAEMRAGITMPRLRRQNAL